MNNYGNYTSEQIAGSEFGGTYSHNTVQPQGADALTAGDNLRLGYLVGDVADNRVQDQTTAEDRRQMLGLKPASNRPPWWLEGTGRVPIAEQLGVEYPDSECD